jgi:RNA polymerase sigma factor (sigma-70 family)
MREPLEAEGVVMGSATRADLHPRLGIPQSRRLLRLAGDDRLAQQIQRGSDAAFEVAFERHVGPILGFCRHMLGSQEEAEDAVQQTFAAAYADLQRGGEREIALKAWLFAIARNRCLSMLRARRETGDHEAELATAGLAEQVERRAELRRLLADLRELPEEQREALLLAEAGGLAHADIAAILGCEVGTVKGLVYRARSALVARRDARELACESVREQLANLRGGSLRRNELRLHLRDCPGCNAFREQVREQRRMLAVALPVVPTLGLKSNVLAAIGIGGGAAAAGGAAVGGGAGVAGGSAGALGGAAKVAAVAAIAVGGIGGGTAVVVSNHRPPSAGTDGAAQSAPARPGDGDAVSAPGAQPSAGRPAAAESQAGGSQGQSATRSHGRRAEARRELRAGDQGAQGRGRVDAPPANTPVRRGPPEGKGKPEDTGRPRQKARPERQAPKAQGGAPAGTPDRGSSGEQTGKADNADKANKADKSANPHQPG